MTLDRGVKLFLLIAMPVYAMLFFILIFDNYTHDAEGEINHIKGHGGTGSYSSFLKSSPSGSSSFYAKSRIHRLPFTRKLAAFRGNPNYMDKAGEEEGLADQKLNKEGDSFTDKNENFREVSEQKLLNMGAQVHASSSFSVNYHKREMGTTDAYSDQEIIHLIPQIERKGIEKNSLLQNNYAARVKSLKFKQKYEAIEASEPETSDYDPMFDSDSDEDNNNYDESFDQYKYKNYVKHNLFTDLFKPRYIIENHALCHANTQIFVFINSRSSQTQTRSAIRHTYLRHLVLRKNVSYAFVISKPEDNKDLKTLIRENKIHGDLILITNEESYTNLTLKTGHILHWSKKNCPSATYIAKVDDDVYVNVPEFLKVLEVERNFTILGKVCSNCVPFTGSPYSLKEALLLFSNVVTLRHMPLTQFPPFAMGPAYVMTNDVTSWLLEAAQLLPYFSYEDVFWTSLVVEVVNEESGITFDLPDVEKQVEKVDGERREEEEESVKYKYLTMKEEKSPAVSIARVNIPNWRIDRKYFVETSLKSNLSPIIIHGIRWREDKHLIDALGNFSKEYYSVSSPSSLKLDSSKVQTWEHFMDRELIQRNSSEGSFLASSLLPNRLMYPYG